MRRRDAELAGSLARVVRWVVSALAADLRERGLPGAEVLDGVLDAAPVGHIRHFEYLKADWPRRCGSWIDCSRWGEFFAMHSDAFWVSIQTFPTLAGRGFCDGTFIVDHVPSMHRVRLSQGDVAIWFGDAVQDLTAGAVHAAKHMVLIHRSYKQRFLKQGPRRVTMFHVYPHNRTKEALVEASIATSKPLQGWTLHAQYRPSQRVLYGDVSIAAAS
mmetsp:Transcript_129543/g.414272  ORF Transcript_129543/g.414272 Transcript_129543/m.414272 type:complete len:216 (-) Transcript_129543:101-748(-)